MKDKDRILKNLYRGNRFGLRIRTDDLALHLYYLIVLQSCSYLFKIGKDNDVFSQYPLMRDLRMLGQTDGRKTDPLTDMRESV